MKQFVRKLAIAGLLLLTAGVYAQDKNFYVFLCFGHTVFCSELIKC